MIEPLGPCGQHFMGGNIVNDRGASAPANVGSLGAEGPSVIDNDSFSTFNTIV